MSGLGMTDTATEKIRELEAQISKLRAAVDTAEYRLRNIGLVVYAIDTLFNYRLDRKEDLFRLCECVWNLTDHIGSIANQEEE